ncbi:uncharacterized protein LOC142351701 [Convolutriloba macropyga]|uniref:uncharacterized protein LOC142351701 n=1 Tax=Convolutriloba macropyga TaxID=536237 RepID=UPI003F528643
MSEPRRTTQTNSFTSIQNSRFSDTRTSFSIPEEFGSADVACEDLLDDTVLVDFLNDSSPSLSKRGPSIFMDSVAFEERISRGKTPHRGSFSGVSDGESIAKTLCDFRQKTNHVFRVCLSPNRKSHPKATQNNLQKLEHYYVIFFKPFDRHDIVIVFGAPADDDFNRQCAFDLESIICGVQAYISQLQDPLFSAEELKTKQQEIVTKLTKLLATLDPESDASAQFLTSILNYFISTATENKTFYNRNKQLAKCYDVLYATKHCYEKLFLGQDFGRVELNEDDLESSFHMLRGQINKLSFNSFNL